MTFLSFFSKLNVKKISSCDEVTDSLLNIVYKTLLFIRHCPNLRVAQIAASHAHNIPALIRGYSAEKLKMYWFNDRAYLERIAIEENIDISLIKEVWIEVEPTILRAIKEEFGRENNPRL